MRAARWIVLVLVLVGVAFGVGRFLRSSLSNGQAPVAAQAPASKDGYRVGDRLEPPAKQEKPTTPASYEEVEWFALVPKGWDPMKMFNENMDKLTDADPRAMEALDKLREVWDNAPVEPSMNGARIRIPGFVVALDSEGGKLKEFLLVPYFGACIHTPPPPANQIIHVYASKPLDNVKTMDAVWISGTLEAAKSRTADNTMGLVGSVGYQMKADIVAPYEEKKS